MIIARNHSRSSGSIFGCIDISMESRRSTIMKNIPSLARIFLSTFFGLHLFAAAHAAQDDEYVDFTELMTPVCEVDKLKVSPPDRWINVPIQTEETAMRGCQMMLIIDQALIGVLRVLSFDLSNPPADMPRWEEHVIGVESILIYEMDYRLHEPIWKRDEVPIAGAGFGGARAIGFSANIEGNDNPQEAHFLVFENTTHKYLISLLTPAKSVDGGTHYNMNTKGMAVVMQNFRGSSN